MYVSPTDTLARGRAPVDAAEARIGAFLDARPFERPVLVMDLESIRMRYRDFVSDLNGVEVFYAVKANPAPEIVALLVEEGASFDAASRGEIALCLEQGAEPERISFGNTIKRPADIAWAHAAGIRLFAADAAEELGKIAEHAPGADVYLRLLVERTEAVMPLGCKFGAPSGEALGLLREARALGLNPVGLSFHIGSQTPEARMWEAQFDETARIWEAARSEGFDLTLLNIGGGFPVSYTKAVQDPASYARAVSDAVRQRFGAHVRVMAEPGRAMVAESGMIAAEVLLAVRRRPDDAARWVYLDIGMFSGLAEAVGDGIRYAMSTTADGGAVGPCVLAGPTCDSVDVLYDQQTVDLPLALKAGDRVRIHAAGAYTSSYSTVGFNGFPPLETICI